MIRVLSVCLALCAGQAMAGEERPPLDEVEKIRSSLLEAAVAYEVEQACPEIERRAVRVAIEGWKLAYYAQTLGYSRREIRSFFKDKTEVDELRLEARVRLAADGIELTDKAEVCDLGASLIKKRTLAGSLLRWTGG
jgi:AraC-like DNA-binding protein